MAGLGFVRAENRRNLWRRYWLWRPVPSVRILRRRQLRRPVATTPEKTLAPTASAPVAGGAAQGFVAGRDIPGEWWKVFHSKEIDVLIAEALRANPNLQAAQAALWQAKETLYAQAGTMLPSFDANGSFVRQAISPAEFGFPGFPPETFNLFQATVNVSYAPDVFGGQRRAIEATAAVAENQRFALEATYLTLTSNVVTAAIQEASLRGQIEATQDIIKAESDQLMVVRNQFEAGAATRADVLQQESEVATTEASLPPLQKQLEQQRHVILALIGRFPSEALHERLTLASFHLPTALPISLPSQLVQQRPDVRAAQALLQQASAQIGVAIANRLPQFAITGDIGSAALTAATLFTPATAIWSIGVAGTQPIFHGFTLLHQERAARAGFEKADAQYRSTVITAFQNVADVLRALQLDAATLKAQQRAVRAASDTFDLTRGQYRLGAITYVVLLMPSAAISRRGSHWCRRKRPGLPTPPRCSRRWAAAGGTVSMSRPTRTAPNRKSYKRRAIDRRR